jgi:hypothetical protein
VELTLRKASKLVNKIDKKLGEMRGEVSDVANFRVSIHEPVEQSVQQIDDSTDSAHELLVNIERLMTIRTEIRKGIGHANSHGTAKAGDAINMLVSDLAGLQQRIAFFSGFVANAIAKVDKQSLRERIATLAAAERAYVNTIDAGSLPQDILDGLKEQIQGWQHRIEEIHDRLEYLNTHTAITLDKAHETKLRELRVLY